MSTSTLLCGTPKVTFPFDIWFKDVYFRFDSVRTDPGKSWNFIVQNSRPGKFWEKSIGPGKPWKFLKTPGILKQCFWIFNSCLE